MYWGGDLFGLLLPENQQRRGRKKRPALCHGKKGRGVYAGSNLLIRKKAADEYLWPKRTKRIAGEGEGPAADRTEHGGANLPLQGSRSARSKGGAPAVRRKERSVRRSIYKSFSPRGVAFAGRFLSRKKGGGERRNPRKRGVER